MKSSRAAPMNALESKSGRYFAVLTLATVAISVFFALTSPFGAVEYLSFPERWMYWFFTLAETQIAFMVLKRLLPKTLSLNMWSEAAIASCIATPLVFFTITWMQSYLELAGPPQNPLWMVSFIWPICLAACVIYSLLDNLIENEHSSSTDQPVEKTAKEETADLRQEEHLLRSRLPRRLRSEEIYALTAQDHYVEIHTAGGSALVHTRFSDATQLVSAEGIKVHRSWWVAKNAVSDLTKNGSKTTLVLTNGLEVPVSKHGMGKLREAGWFV